MIPFWLVVLLIVAFSSLVWMIAYNVGVQTTQKQWYEDYPVDWKRLYGEKVKEVARLKGMLHIDVEL